MQIKDIIFTEKHKLLSVLLKSGFAYRTQRGDEIIIACPRDVKDTLEENTGLLIELEQAIEEKTKQKYKISLVVSDNTEEGEGRSLPSKSILPGQIITSFRLNKEMTFDNFEVGNSNKMAFTVALRIANEDLSLSTRANNLIYIHGMPGVGKTHLLTAIAWRLLERGKTIAVFTGETFTHFAVHRVLKSNAPNTDRRFYNNILNADAFMIDDIQYLSRKKQTQDVLKNILDRLYLPNKVTVFTSNIIQNQLIGFNNLVISRLNDGYTVDIQPPDVEVKKALLTKYFATFHISPSAKIMDLLLSIPVASVRDLRKIATAVDGLYSVNPNPGVKDVENILQKNTGFLYPLAQAYISKILDKYITGKSSVTLNTLKGKLSNRLLRELREVVIFESYTNNKRYTIPVIASIFQIGTTTVFRSIKNVEKRIAADPYYLENVKKQFSVI